MPIYEYRCGKCGFQKEFLQRVSDAPLRKCPECGKPALSKLVTAAGFQLKGTGWYATDFRGDGAKPAAKADKTEAKQDSTPAVADKPAKDAAKPSAETKPARAADAPANSN